MNNLTEDIRSDLTKIFSERNEVVAEEDDNNDLIALLYAYEHGVDDGFFDGNEKNTFSTNEQRHAYSRGYDHGVWMYTENTHPAEAKSNE
jgi:hypothetical protein